MASNEKLMEKTRRRRVAGAAYKGRPRSVSSPKSASCCGHSSSRRLCSSARWRPSSVIASSLYGALHTSHVKEPRARIQCSRQSRCTYLHVPEHSHGTMSGCPPRSRQMRHSPASICTESRKARKTTCGPFRTYEFTSGCSERHVERHVPGNWGFRNSGTVTPLNIFTPLTRRLGFGYLSLERLEGQPQRLSSR